MAWIVRRLAALAAPLLVLVLAISTTAPVAQAQSTVTPSPSAAPRGSERVVTPPKPFVCVPACPPTAPSITVNPSSGTFVVGIGPQSITITACDAVGSISFSTWSVTLNGANVTSSFPLNSTTISGCQTAATATGNLTLVTGTNTLSVSLANTAGLTGPGGATYTGIAATYGVTVTPGVSAMVEPPGQTATLSFTVKNTGNTQNTFTIAAVCSGASVASCGTPSVTSTTLLPNASQSVTLSATASTTNSATGSVGISATGKNASTTGSTQFTVQPPAVAVAPNGTTLNVDDFGATVTDTFRVSNLIATSQTFTITFACGGGAISQCAAPGSVTVAGNATVAVPVTFVTSFTSDNLSTFTLTATNGLNIASATHSYNADHFLGVSTVYTDWEDHDVSRCAPNCFTTSVTLNTVPYISRDTPRSVRLVYQSEGVALRPVVMADVTTDNAANLQKLRLQALVHGTWATFTNGETALYFAPPPAGDSAHAYRLSGVVNVDATLPANPLSGAYEMQIVVTAFYTDGHTEQFTDTTHALALWNTRTSKLARGWTIAGVPTQYSYNHANGTINQLKMMWAQGDGTTMTYTTTNGCQPVCVPTLPTGVYSTIVEHFFSNGMFDTFRHVYPDSSFEAFGGCSAPGDPAASCQTAYSISRTQADTTSYTYDSLGAAARLTRVSDPQLMYNGQHSYIVLHYDSLGHLFSIVEPRAGDAAPDSGRITRVIVDRNGLLRAWMDPDSGTTKFGYDTAGRLDSLVDRLGNVTTYAYEPIASRMVQFSGPLVPIDWSSTGNAVPIHLAASFTPWQLVGVPTGATSTTPWTPPRLDAIKAVVINSAPDTITFTADRWGQPLINTDPLHQITTTVRDTNGFPSTVTGPTGAVDSYAHAGPLLQRYSPATLVGSAGYTYGAFAQPTGVNPASGPSVTYVLGNRGHTDSVLVNNAAKTHYFADALGRDTLITDATGDTTRFQYDTRTGNRQTVTHSPGGRFTRKTFDGEGRDSSVYVSGRGTSTVTLYDKLNRVTSTSDGVNARPTVRTWDALYLRSITDPNNQTYTYTYNPIGLMVSETDPGNRTESFTYTTRLFGATTTNRRNQTVKYLYDALGRPVKEHRPVNLTGETDTLETIGISAGGDTVNAWTPASRDISFYSRATRLLDSTVTYLNDNKFKITNYRNSQGRIDSVLVVTTNVTGADLMAHRYYYNKTTQALDSMKIGTQKIAFRYDTLGRTDSIIYPNNVLRLDTYNALGSLATTTWTGLNAGLYRGYGYDSTGHIGEVDYGVQGGSLELFTYNGLRELTNREAATFQDTTACKKSLAGFQCSSGRRVTVNEQERYAWDGASNLDTLLNVTSSSDTIASYATGNRLSGWGPFTYVSDTDGNRLSAVHGSTTTQYVWGADGRLLSASANGTTLTYDYNAFGRIVRRSRNGTVERYYLWSGDQLLAILDGAANTRIAEFAYQPNTVDRPLARITGTPGATTVHFYAQDGEGNIVGQFSGTTIEQSLAYEPWGTPSVATITGDTTQLRWKGLLYEGDVTSLSYVRSRWYDPIARRFVSPDPDGLSAGINQFAFAGGDPINGQDPTGLDDDCTDPSGVCSTDPGNTNFTCNVDDQGLSGCQQQADSVLQGIGADPIDWSALTQDPNASGNNTSTTNTNDPNNVTTTDAGIGGPPSWAQVRRAAVAICLAIHLCQLSKGDDVPPPPATGGDVVEVMQDLRSKDDNAAPPAAGGSPSTINPQGPQQAATAAAGASLIYLFVLLAF